MKRQTRAFLLNAATGIAIAATAALVLMPTVASAAPAYATTLLNMREAPNSNARVIDRIEQGEPVDTILCEGGWCHVNASGSYGYVSQRYLSTTRPTGGISIGIGQDGVSIGVNVGNQPRPPLPPDDEDDDEFYTDGEACFFGRTQKRGESFCVSAGDNIPDLGGWTGDIRSLDNPDGLDVTICTRTRFRGDCRTYTTGANTLGRFDSVAASVRVD